MQVHAATVVGMVLVGCCLWGAPAAFAAPRPAPALSTAAVSTTPTLSAAALPPGSAPVAAADEAAFLRLYFPADQLVEAPTRHPKPLSQVAENVTVVTAAEIRDMNAHTLGEVLARVPGVFAQFLGVQFGSTVLPHIQGSGETQFNRFGADERHVTVLLDGIPWNSLAGGPSLETIPLGIVERIEVIKGPGSSTWGPSLAGVVNVITRPCGSRPRPRAHLSASYGESHAWDARAGVAGAAGPLGYSLYGQRQGADWADPLGRFDSRAAFAKASAPLGPRARLTLSGGYSRAETDIGHLPSEFAFADDDLSARFARAALALEGGGGLGLQLEGYRYDQLLDQWAGEDGVYAPYGDLLLAERYDETSHGAQGRAVWRAGRHTLVAGADYHRAEQHQTSRRGAAFGSPPPGRFTPTLDRWGVYLNDTLRLGPLTLTPGLRYDDTSRSDPFTSPSLGATWQLGAASVLRATVARGFTAPPLAWLSGGGMGIDPNPDLDPEQVWSYQAGAESGALGWLWLKATVFRHEVRDALEVAPSSGPAGWQMVNRGSVWRSGAELEAETAPWAGLVLRGSFTVTRVEKSAADRDQDLHAATGGAYWRRGPWRAQLLGRHVWWDLATGSGEGGVNDPLFDLDLARGLELGRARAELYAAVHNLFNGDLNTSTDQGTWRRWVEGGLRLDF